MTSTEKFRKLPEYYSSVEECKGKRSNIVSNPRYGKKGFYQTHFTAGDEEQFQEYRDATNGEVCIQKINLDSNRFEEIDLSKDITWGKYKDLNATCVNNTFRYMFNKFKKGIFVKIQDNELRVFLPFSKASFVNEWGNKIKVDPKFGDMYSYAKYINDLGKNRFRISVNNFPSNWYANNCLVRYEFPINEGDTNVPSMSDMLKTLCANRKIPDIEFFVNRRDFPVIRKNGTEAYDHLFGDNIPLVSHNYEKYCPILSMVTTDEFADIPIPTGDDWGRISSYESKYFDRGCKVYPKPEDFNIKWKNKKPTAIFRGASTGCGVTIETNARLKLAYLSINTPKDDKGVPLLDAGITKWQLRPRKLKNEKYLQTINVLEMNKKGIQLASFVSPYEQSEYKYIVHVDGHVSAFRLSLEMSMGCVILLIDSPYRLWFKNMMEPMVHYVPVKADLSNLIEQIKWCRDNDDKCKKIAKQSKKFYLKYLQKDGVLDYLQKLIVDIKNETGQYLYNNETPLHRQIRLEKKLNVSYPETKKTISDIGNIPRQARSYGILKGMEWLLNFVNDKSCYDKVAKKGKDIFSSKGGAVVVKDYKLAGFSFVAKETTDNVKEMENIHEAFIGQKCINDILTYIPNFAYVLGSCDQSGRTVVLMEKIIGVTLTEWLESDKFNMKDFVFILIQLSFSLEVAQRQCGFVHYDLTPWNIMIQELPVSVDFDYVIDSDNIFRINTNLIPIIIDYGKSHVIYKDTHYGFINMYKTSTIQDIISILITSINSITSLTLSDNDVKIVLTLMNFISNSGYRNRPFRKTGKKGVSDVQYFIKNSKKYTELINSNKYDLEKLTPFDFIKYINKNIKYTFSYQKIDYPKFRINKGNPRQVFEYILSNDNKQKIMSFVNIFQNVIDCDFPVTNNLFFDYYSAQTLENNITSVYVLMNKHLQKNKIDSKKYDEFYKKATKKIKAYYGGILSSENEKIVEYDRVFVEDLEHCPYDESTFLKPSVILHLLNKYSENEINDICDYHNIVLKVFLNNGVFKLSDRHRKYYLDNFNDLLKINCLNMKNNNANINTLRETSKGIYSNDKNFLDSKLDNKNVNKNCNSATKYLELYNKILNI